MLNIKNKMESIEMIQKKKNKMAKHNGIILSQNKNP